MLVTRLVQAGTVTLLPGSSFTHSESKPCPEPNPAKLSSALTSVPSVCGQFFHVFPHSQDTEEPDSDLGMPHLAAGPALSVSPLCKPSQYDLKEFFFALATEVRKTILGPLSPKCSLLANLKAVLQRMLPEDSYLLASGRLHISLTRVVDGQNVMASEFSSKEELIQALLCSCFLPIYCGFIPPSYRGVRYVDGGFTGLQPVSSLEEPVITVSPFTGELDICPRDCPAIFFCFQIFNGSIQISIENLCRISYALFPPSTMVSPPGLLPA
uniref:PNPLA domain-containing protein n=1 Tax=Zosterops lateralis melanops TaxID=1220523 RepID=A0A8D2NYE8_ZOSLA